MTKRISSSQVLTLIFCFLIPTQLGKHFWPGYTFVSNIKIDYLSPTLYLTHLIILLLIVINYRQIPKLFFNFKYKYIFLTIFFFSFLSWSQTSSLQSLLLPFLYLGLIFAGTYFVVQNLKNNNIQKLAAVSLILGLLLQTILSSYQWQTGHSFNRFAYWLGERETNISQPFSPKTRLINTVKLRPSGTFSHPNSLSAYAVIVAVLIFQFLPKSSSSKKIIIGLLILSSIIIFITQSFNTYYSLFLSLLTLIIYSHLFKNTRILLVPLVLGIIIPLILPFVPFFPTNDSLSRRIIHYQTILPYIRAFPLGTGPNQYISHLPQFITPSIELLQPLHNTYWLIILQLGIPLSLLIFLSFSQQIPHKPKPLFIFLSSFVLYTAIFDHYWITLAQNQLLLVLVFHLARNGNKPDKI